MKQIRNIVLKKKVENGEVFPFMYVNEGLIDVESALRGESISKNIKLCIDHETYSDNFISEKEKNIRKTAYSVNYNNNTFYMLLIVNSGKRSTKVWKEITLNDSNKLKIEINENTVSSNNESNHTFYNNTLTEISLDVYRGLFVPNIEWGRVFCQQNENYYHLTVPIDPSIRNISDLWNNYLKAIHNEAKELPEKKYFVHFTGINFSFPEVWIPAVKSLVDADNIRVPVDGLPYWVPNLYFFFTPVFNPDAFPITEEIFSLFPAINDKIPDKNNKIEIMDNIRNEILLELIKDKMIVNDKNAKLICNRLLKGYSSFYLNKWREVVK